jgi:hypothetical protein
MLKTKLMLVSSFPGGRADFIAGWLGLLPNFVDSGWCIDPVTGQSYGNMRFTKMLDKGKSFEDIWLKQFELSADADLYVTGSCHGFQLESLKNEINAGSVKIVSVTISDLATDFKKLKWDFVVKTYLSQNKVSHYRAIKSNTWNIDQNINKSSSDITANDRIAAVDQLLKNPVSALQYCPEIIGATTVEYNLLFQPNGSQYLCKQLGINVDDAYHQYWNHMLLIADSPDVLNVWGHTWRKEDYLK